MRTTDGAPIAWPIRVEEGRYLMLGDNRDHSKDGRVWGTVRLAEIKGPGPHHLLVLELQRGLAGGAQSRDLVYGREALGAHRRPLGTLRPCGSHLTGAIWEVFSADRIQALLIPSREAEKVRS